MKIAAVENISEVYTSKYNDYNFELKDQTYMSGVPGCFTAKHPVINSGDSFVMAYLKNKLNSRVFDQYEFVSMAREINFYIGFACATMETHFANVFVLSVSSVLAGRSVTIQFWFSVGDTVFVTPPWVNITTNDGQNVSVLFSASKTLSTTIQNVVIDWGVIKTVTGYCTIPKVIFSGVEYVGPKMTLNNYDPAYYPYLVISSEVLTTWDATTNPQAYFIVEAFE